MRVTLNKAYKSIPDKLSFSLPSFSILTGKNGSGKSHLLEAMADGNFSHIYDDLDNRIWNIQHVAFNGLNPQVEDQADPIKIASLVSDLWGHVQNAQYHYKEHLYAGHNISDIHAYLPQLSLQQDVANKVSRILKLSNVELQNLTIQHVYEHFNFKDANAGSNNQLFFTQFALIIKAYHTRWIENELADSLATKYPDQYQKELSPDEFVSKYGPPPWELINDILNKAGLPYKVNCPNNKAMSLAYNFKLIDTERDVSISVNDLSTGEKVLMSLALAIYNTQEESSKPDVLLLDEPDAALHPQFSKLLIEIITDTIIKKAGVNVVITTHSPSTVAMAPPLSVFEVDRNSKLPKQILVSEAVNILTEGISFLRVSYENRRQVFVESKYDVEYLQKLYEILKKKHNFKFSPIFLEPHSGTSSCTDVISIVAGLSDSGSDLVYGIIDFDGKNKPTDRISVLGESSRYAVENFLLDPIYVAMALVRDGGKKFGDFGLSNKSVYTDGTSLTASDCQHLVNYILGQLNIKINNVVPVELENGFVIQYPTEYLFYQGHDYENLLQTTFIELNAITRNKSAHFLKTGILKVIEEFPQFLPKELANTFFKIIG